MNTSLLLTPVHLRKDFWIQNFTEGNETFANNKLQILKGREAMECHDHLQIELLRRNKMKGNSQEEWDKSPFLSEKLII